jgi:hypothetical protein
MDFAKTFPTLKEMKKGGEASRPLVLIFGAQATRGILMEDHPYVSCR